MYTDAQKQTLYEMKDAGASWKVIGIALNKKSDAVKRWYKRNKILRGL